MTPLFNTTPATRHDIDRNVLLVTYVLYALGFFFGVSAIAGVIVNHIKLRECEDRFAYSHHRWLMRTFWFALLWFVVCSVLTVVFIGFIGYAILTVWYAYRLIRGALALAEHRALPMPASVRLP